LRKASAVDLQRAAKVRFDELRGNRLGETPGVTGCGGPASDVAEATVAAVAC
jgi:hypothetical protein